MKKVILACIIVLSATFLSAGNWKPYVAQGIVSPASLVPWQLNGTGVVSFNVGNNGSDPLNLIRNQEMKMVLTLSYGIPNVTPLNASTALTVIGGTWASCFNWSYNMLTNSYTGIQNRTIPAQSQGSVTIQYKVTLNSQQGTPANGFNVNLTPPPYTNGVNTTDDDAISSYTFTEARDYGDAPESYGSADHVIDFVNNYSYLGTLVDAEAGYIPSATANGDDDDDGVTFPALTPGTTVNIPVVVTEAEDSRSYISAWIDWNANGNFNDAGDQIATNVQVLNSGTINLSLTVPLNAVTSVPTFARFRLGPLNMNSTGSYPFGEVEDYQIQIINPYIGIDDKKESQQLIIYSFENNIFVKDLTAKELKGKMMVYNLVGQRIAKKALTGGTLNKFSMNVEEGYYIVEVVTDVNTYHGKVYLTR
jgi:GEVED domain